MSPREQRVETHPRVQTKAAHRVIDYGRSIADARGTAFSFGNAHFDGTLGSVTLDEPVVGMATTANDYGFWMAGSSGLIFGNSAPVI